MNSEHLDHLDALGVGFDTETYKIEVGLLAPPIVCGSISVFERGATVGEILTKDDTLDAFRQLLASDKIVVGANIAYDLVVVAVHAARQGIDIIPEIYKALDEERIYDVLIAEALHAIAMGCLGKDPRTGGAILNPETGKRGRYSLATVTDMVLGRTDAKSQDEWRLNYGDLDDVPLGEWPDTARNYPVDDARNTLEVALAQAGIIPRPGRHEWGRGGACVHCGGGTFASLCMRRQRHRNLHALSEQVETAFAMQLGAVWGFSVDQTHVDKVEKKALEGRGEIEKHLAELGILRPKKEKGVERLAMVQSVVKRMVAFAYGAKDPCPRCDGTGKVPSPKNPKAKRNCCDWALDEQGRPVMDEKTKKVAVTKTCDGSGLVLTGMVPRTKKGGIAGDRDTLSESGDDVLLEVGAYDEKKKTLKTYVPFLRKARRLADVFVPDIEMSDEDDEEQEDDDGSES